MFLEGAAVAGFGGWFVGKEPRPARGTIVKMFFFYQALGSGGLLSYIVLFPSESVVGCLCLIRGLGLKIGASLVFPPWVLWVSGGL